MEDDQGSRGGMRSRRIRRRRMRKMGRNRMRRIMGRRRISGRRMRRMTGRAQVFRVFTMCIENFVMTNPPSDWLPGRGGGREEGGGWQRGG